MSEIESFIDKLDSPKVDLANAVLRARVSTKNHYYIKEYCSAASTNNITDNLDDQLFKIVDEL
jgi:hypothetical protein